MALYAISDLHLAFNSDKPMDIFGEKWSNHDENIKANWIEKINDDDMTLIAGDISWSMKNEDSKEDLQWINNLPGTKIISKGNHDYWWAGISKLNKMYDKIQFIQNNFFVYKDYAICGTRGWILPGFSGFSEHDDKIYKRELIRLELSLEAAEKAGYTKKICMVHYPPFNDKCEESGFTLLFKKYGVEKVIYGHIHGAKAFKSFNGILDGIEYRLTSCDFLGFSPIKILD